ncbi:hypothetical protein V5O48_009292 [Marasmius crinis-equi]|uniref:Methyltransferase n=1 Tax=Marasmius crinis-equi TaxID=585013 RepID=A0ABR3FBP1_9AGAR
MPGLNIDTVAAKLNYFARTSDGGKPYNYVAKQPVGVPQSNSQAEEYVLQIENVRGKEDAYSLDTSGFYFGKHAASHKSFANNEEVEKEYYPESIELIKRLTGASKVVLFDHMSSTPRPTAFKSDELATTQAIRRRVEGSSGLDPNKRGPVSRVHVDQTPLAAHNRVRRHLPEEEAEERLKHRFQIINLWRPISHPAEDWPLAVCDFRSVNWEKDLIPAELRYSDNIGETFAVKHNPEHKWKYVRGLTPEEFILIKCYDSIEDGSVAVLTPHTAFQDPTTPAGAPARESIELRALVFYDD